MTKKFLKEWDLEDVGQRADIQQLLDGGATIYRQLENVYLYYDDKEWLIHTLESPGRAVKFAAALNKLRRPMHLIKQDLDADWAERVKARDNQTCVGCGVQGDKIGATIPAHTAIDTDTGEETEVRTRTHKDVLTAHHWLKTKSRAGMARWARPCGVTYHYAEHVHTLHENPCWVDLEKIYRHVAIVEGEAAIHAALALVGVEPTEARVRELWLERCGKSSDVK